MIGLKKTRTAKLLSAIWLKPGWCGWIVGSARISVIKKGSSTCRILIDSEKVTTIVKKQTHQHINTFFSAALGAHITFSTWLVTTPFWCAQSTDREQLKLSKPMSWFILISMQSKKCYIEGTRKSDGEQIFFLSQLSKPIHKYWWHSPFFMAPTIILLYTAPSHCFILILHSKMNEQNDGFCWPVLKSKICGTLFLTITQLLRNLSQYKLKFWILNGRHARVIPITRTSSQFKAFHPLLLASLKLMGLPIGLCLPSHPSNWPRDRWPLYRLGLNTLLCGHHLVNETDFL